VLNQIGRTARLGRKGYALLFLTDTEKPFADELSQRNVSSQFPTRNKDYSRVCVYSLQMKLTELTLESIFRKFTPNRTQHRGELEKKKGSFTAKSNKLVFLVEMETSKGERDI
jgi:superfamily II DNA/RNA helicase